MIRSDVVAAKVMQSAIKEGRGDQVLPSKGGQAGAEAGASVASPLASKVSPKKSSLSEPVGPSAPTAVREKVESASNAYLSLLGAFEAIGPSGSLVMESDDVTAIEFAKHVLANVEAEAVNAIGGKSSPDSEGEGQIGEAEDALYQDQSDGAATILDVGAAKMALRETADEDVVELADSAHLSIVVSAKAMTERGAAEAVWEEDKLSINFESGAKLEILNATNAGSIALRNGGTDLVLLPPKIPPKDGLLDITV